LDYVHRDGSDLYGDFLDLSTGRVTDSSGRPFDLTLVSNTPKAKRTYNGVTADIRYRWSALQVGGNYTLSKTWGNFNGENVGSGPIRATFDTFPEYREESWNYPWATTLVTSGTKCERGSPTPSRSRQPSVAWMSRWFSVQIRVWPWT
jgi:hypothetical protein